ncbi:hypothetical protein [Halalkalibacter krulwichiae]|uniref:Uncharacterized protein n=1 Tax=Halalkalibacter krulwichiae TaxID=199441 RepID=A0A1X9M6V7_9BACI|nr:hypothetical protein [Halalkalibacter krulwichiae]ARK29158.1 hypothetical protein BkAM31D_04410 [Halalkalibacter krulwichiae]
MIEIITDLTSLWVSVVMTVLLVAAMTKANILRFEWELHTGWKRKFVDVSEQEPENPMLIHLSRMKCKPKIPSTNDHKNQDDDDATSIVFI